MFSINRTRKISRTAAWISTSLALAIGVLTVTMTGCQGTSKSAQLSDAQVENIVRRAYQYVAMFNVNTKMAIGNAESTGTSGWNMCVADTQIKDHEFKSIARPNNDTLYTGCMLDLRHEPVIVEYPAFDTKYAVLETSGFDHYCEIPLSTTKGDFARPTTILYYSARTDGYDGSAIEGVDQTLEMSGDFVIAFLRVMPHASEPERMKRNIATMQKVTARTLTEYLGTGTRVDTSAEFPGVGSDLDVFENNFLEVMQFVFNHTTFDPDDELDQALLQAFEPLGIRPGQAYDDSTVAGIDGKRFRAVAEKVQKEAFAQSQDSAFSERFRTGLFKPKGQMPLELMVMQSVVGPIGVPASEAMYVPVGTESGEPLNAMNDYIMHMAPDEMPPAGAFWSATLYDAKNGFFIPNDNRKYSVGENAGMQLNDDGGIDIHIAVDEPAGVPEENWLPIQRKDEDLDVIIRIYEPDQQKMKTWAPPNAETILRSE